MKRYLVLSIVGCDRVGTTARVAAFVGDRGGNIERCCAARFGAAFGIQALIAASLADAGRMMREVEAELSDLSPTISLTDIPPLDRDERAMQYELTVFAYDHVGIVSETAGLLAEFGVDIVHLAACTYSAPQNGTPLFHAEFKLDVPRKTSLKILRKAFYDLECAMNWDIDFRPDMATTERSNGAVFPPARDLVHFEREPDDENAAAARLN